MKKHRIISALIIMTILTAVTVPVSVWSSEPFKVPKIDGIVVDESLPTLKSVLDHYINALGGREAMEKLTSRICTGQFVEDMPSRQPPVKNNSALKAVAEVPDRWIVSLNLSNGTKQNGYDGKTGWRQNPDRIEIDNRMRRSWMGFLFNPQGPLRIDEYYTGMREKGATR